MERTASIVLAALALGVAAGNAACGNLDNITNVKDLRVLAVRADPAGFLVDLTNPGAASATSLQATLTALVVDPKGASQTVTFSAVGCPDYLDSITGATGQTNTVCPPPGTPAAVPAPYGPALATATIISPSAPGTDAPTADSAIEYNPQVTFGLTPEQIGLFFSTQTTGIAAVDQAVQDNRIFGMDAIVNLTFNLGTEIPAQAIKHVVYWPQLATGEIPNQNPTITDVQFFRQRNTTTGEPQDPYTDAVPTVSVAARDQLFVLPVPAADAAEPYLLNVKNRQTMQIETQSIPAELLTYDFYTTAGTFSPAERRSQLSPLLTTPDGKVHLDSQLNLPGSSNLPPGGDVTLWIVVHDERAGESWVSRHVTVTP